MVENLQKHEYFYVHSSEGIYVIHESEPCVTSERTKSEIQIKLSAGGCWRQSVLKKVGSACFSKIFVLSSTLKVTIENRANAFNRYSERFFHTKTKDGEIVRDSGKLFKNRSLSAGKTMSFSFLF